MLNGILWVLRTGARWRDAPTEYGPWQTLSTRFYRWVNAGLWGVSTGCSVRVLASRATACWWGAIL